MSHSKGSVADNLGSKGASLSICLMDAAKGDFFVSNFVDADRDMIEKALVRSGNTDKAILDHAQDMFGEKLTGWFGLYGLKGFCTPSFYLALNAQQDAGGSLDTLEALGVKAVN